MIVVKIYKEMEKAIKFFEDDYNVSQLQRKEDGVSLQFLYKGTNEEQSMMLKRAISQDIAIISFSDVETNLEDVFMEITKGVELI